MSIDRLTQAAGAMLAALAASLVPSATMAQAPDYPTRAVRLIVGFPPGGPVDVTSRTIAERLSERLKQPVLVEHMPGANGVIAIGALAKAAPDGYTLMMGASTIPIQVTMMKNPPFDVERDIEPIAMVGQAPLVLVVNTKLPVANVAELVALVKCPARQALVRQPLERQRQPSGRGAVQDDQRHRFRERPLQGRCAGRDRSDGRPCNDALRRRLDAAARSRRAHARARDHHARPIAGGAGHPDDGQSGFPGFDVATWYGVMGPAGMPRSIVARLNADVNKSAEEVRDRLARFALSPVPGTPEQFREFMRREQTRWAKVIRDAAITAD